VSGLPTPSRKKKAARAKKAFPEIESGSIQAIEFGEQ
jgi:hypothetical protein